MRTIPLLLLLVLPSFSCVSAVRVYEEVPGKEPVRLPGLPFYGKTGRSKRTTIYEQRWLEATLTIETFRLSGTGADQKKIPLAQTSYSRTVAFQNADQLTAVERLVAKGDEASVGLFLGLPLVDAAIQANWPGSMTANHSESIAVVDYEKKMYLNAPLPWNGSATVAPEYKDDGTLGKVTTTTEQDVGAILPVKELVTSVLGIGAGGAGVVSAMRPTPGPPGPDDRWSVRLDVRLGGQSTTFTQTVKEKEDLLPVLDQCHQGDGYTTKPLSASSSAGKSDSKSYSFSGSVTPPQK